MDAVSDPAVHTVVLMKSAQVGGTEVLLNVVGFHIDQDPAPILMVQPTVEMGQAWSKDRLAPMLRDTPALRGKVAEARSRDSGNTVLHKTFPGGHITIAGANSAAGLASRPIRIALFDEVDRFPPSAGTEGDPVNLGSKRTLTFWNRKRVLVSTPTIRGASRIEAAYETGTQEVCELPCPHCDEYQALQWGQVHWQRDEDGNHLPDTAVYVCEHCGAAIEERQKADMLKAHRWVAGSDPGPIVSLRISELYSPWSTWADMVRAFLEAKPRPETLKTWVNTALGETWEEAGEQPDSEGLGHRREPYSREELPEGVLVLTAGVDVQDDRLEVEVVGWAEGEESWGVEYHVIHADPAGQDAWSRLDEFLAGKYRHASGVMLPVAATMVDSGHHTQSVYRFVKPRYERRIYACKGVSTAGSPLLGKPSRRNAGQIPLFPIGTDTAKSQIYSRMRIDVPGPGYMHFPSAYDDEYFAQLAAEKIVTKYVRGFPTRVWIKTRARNEALDCRVYAMAALEELRPNYEAWREHLSKVAAPVQPKPRGWRVLSEGVE